MSSNPAYWVAGLLEKMSNSDSDFRYMAANDFITELQKASFSLDDASEKKMVNALLKLLQDKNGEVQNLAVKCFGPLIKKVREVQVIEIVDRMSAMMVDKSEDLRDIAGIGIKTVIVELAPDAQVTVTIVKRLMPRLLALLRENQTVQIDNLDVVIEILTRFGSIVASETELQGAVKETLIPLLRHNRPAVRKRSTLAISILVTTASDKIFVDFISYIRDSLTGEAKGSNAEQIRTFVGCVGTLSRYDPQRLGPHLSTFVPIILQFIQHDDEDLREVCLQTLESFVLRCPSEITDFLPDVISTALVNIKYDPNYAGTDDEDDDDEEMDVDEDDEEEEEEEEDYSDDDDRSWKVRKASAKLLGSIISTRTEILETIYSVALLPLIRRFGEREESVRIDVINTVTVLVKQTGIVTGVTLSRKTAISANTGLTETLKQQLPTLNKHLLRQLSSKSIPTRLAGFNLLKELVATLQGGLEAHISALIPVISTSCTHAQVVKTATTSNLRIDALGCLRVLLMTHEPQVFSPHLAKLVALVIKTLSDPFYKIRSEGLLVTIEIVKVLRPKTELLQGVAPSSTAAGYANQFYTVVMERLQSTDVDLEVKERSINALVVLLAQAGDLIPEHDVTTQAIPFLLDRLKNELTRLVTVRGIKVILDSPLVAPAQDKSPLRFEPVLNQMIAEIVGFLRKTQRQLRVSSLAALESIARVYGAQISLQSYQEILNELRPLLSDSDAHIIPLAMETLCSIVLFSPKEHGLVSVVEAQILPPLITVITDTPHLVSAGAGLDALLKLWGSLSTAYGPQIAEKSIALLVEPVFESTQSRISKQGYFAIAKSVAILSGSTSQPAILIQKFVAKVEDGASSDHVRHLSLLCLGEIGRQVDISTLYPNVADTFLGYFSSPSEEIKYAAAFGLGNIAVGNLPKYLPPILQGIRDGGKSQYLLLVSLKETITFSTSARSQTALQEYIDEIWELLFSNTEATHEEGTRSIIAACLGKLSLIDPVKYLPKLQARLTGQSPHIRSTVVAAIRWIFTDHHEHDEYEAMLKPILIDFLTLVRDPDLNVRKVALSTFNLVAHNKPHLLGESLKELLKLLYQETVVKKELIREVIMGPFKHLVDDGLETRKSAFECMHTLLDTCLQQLEIYEFLNVVLIGLSDASNDVKILCHMILQKLATLTPTAMAQRLDDTVDALRATITTKAKENAVKQEIEKIKEAAVSACKTVLILSQIHDPFSNPKFEELLSKEKVAFPELFFLAQQELDSASAGTSMEV
ncbi:Cullin-associated NEDD8-dissociated protein 1 [Polychytrium aggregatum]|uniref:Cullin-associated NEDD8-dissociated protein 1 n=1 Tax=Polychytrium aggregatum TaxID=110093 RepID=UPI0022FE61ED|nr:Cullin-associated NEDD8-dissociated protein 1 [Polychytrium aggregatum]KAI9208792.1 Cullin-associated NEDD8-dissociated protein 1 [Polychytrium aggregatum]